MAIPSSGPISIADINADGADGFSFGNNLNAYKGQIYHQKSNGTVGLLPTGEISLGDFYNRRRVDAGSVTDSSAGSKNYTIPPYRTISFVLRAGSGGGGGGGGGSNNSTSCAGQAGNSGTNGGASSFGNSGNGWYMYCNGGGAGGGGTGNQAGVSPADGSNGADASNYDTSLSRAPGGSGGGNGGRAGGSGGRGGKLSTITFTNPVLGGSGPTSGSSMPLTVGSYGPLGTRGLGGNWQIESVNMDLSPNYGCARNSADRDGTNGGDGAGGYFYANWT